MSVQRRRLLAAVALLAALAVALCVGARMYRHSAKRARRFAGVTIADYDAVAASVREGLKKHCWEIVVSFDARGELLGELGEIAGALMEDAVAETGAADEGDYLRYQIGGYELHYGSEERRGSYRYTLRIRPAYYTTLAQEEWVAEEVGRIMEEMGFTDGIGEEERLHRLYDYVCEHVAYDRVHKHSESNHLKSTAYAALYYHTAACQGYAVLLYRLLREAGVEAHVVTGMAAYGEIEEFHAWNRVVIGGVEYHVDATWGELYCASRPQA